MKNLLFYIVSLAVALRFWSAWPGYPPYHADEGMSYSQGIAMLKEGTLDAHGYSLSYAYPAVIPIINAMLFKTIFIPISWLLFYVRNFGELLDGFLKLFPEQEEYNRMFQLEILGNRDINVLRWGRYISALFGVGNVVMGYLLGKKIYSKQAGLYAAFLIAINYRQVLNSSINLPDIYNAFFLMMSAFVSYEIFRSRTRKTYLLAGLFAGISFSTKFNFYAFLPIIYAHLSQGLTESFKVSQLRLLAISLIVAALIVIMINPYHIVNFEETLSQLHGVSGKYRTGRLALDVYGYSYLYKFGLGRIATIVVLFGIGASLAQGFRKAIYLLSIVFAFFFIITFYTGGGFYTRNFVSVTPILLVFAGFGLTQLSVTIDSKSKKLSIIVMIVLIVLLAYENLGKSIVVAREFNKDWNFQKISKWTEINLPEHSKVAAHPTVPIEGKNIERLRFNPSEDFTINEFQNSDADFAIASLDWATNDFYWWMTQSTKNGLKYWNKPVGFLSESFTGIALEEFQDFSIYSALKPWEAPDSNFIVAKVPRMKNQELGIKRTFEFPRDMWEKFYDGTGAPLLVSESGLTISGTSADHVLRWESAPISLSGMTGILVRGEMRTSSSITEKEGFLVLSLYPSEEDAFVRANRLQVRLSARNVDTENWEQLGVSADIPKEAKYARVGFQVYTPVGSKVQLRKVEILDVVHTEDYNGYVIEPIRIDTNILFPNSHGNL